MEPERLLHDADPGQFPHDLFSPVSAILQQHDGFCFGVQVTAVHGDSQNTGAVNDLMEVDVKEDWVIHVYSIDQIRQRAVRRTNQKLSVKMHPMVKQGVVDLLVMGIQETFVVLKCLNLHTQYLRTIGIVGSQIHKIAFC